MDIAIAREALLWSAVINYGMLLWWFGWFVFNLVPFFALLIVG